MRAEEPSRLASIRQGFDRNTPNSSCLIPSSPKQDRSIGRHQRFRSSGLRLRRLRLDRCGRAVDGYRVESEELGITSNMLSVVVAQSRIEV